MKILPFKYLLLLLLFVPLLSCSDDDDDLPPEVPDSNTIVDIATDDDRFSSLVAALDKAGLANTLAGDGNFTVFAPTNDAFTALFSELGVGGLDDLSAADLTPILLYHVLGQEVSSSQLSEGYVSTLSATGPDDNALSLLVSLNGGPQLNGDVNITQTDIAADNGIVHVIDQVLTPPSVVDIAIANNDFTTLVQALTAGELVDDLSADGPFTVFAPTNEAFVNLLNTLGVGSLGEIPMETLIDVLTYHVVPGNVRSSDLSTGMVSTLNPDAALTITVDGGVVINGNATVTTADVQGSNGVVHVIDEVLVPAEPSNTIVDIAMSDANFSTLVDAVVKAGLAETLSGDGNFTVFAPTNDAFTALFSDLGVTGLDDLTAEQLTPILLYHVLGEEVASTGLSEGYVTTLSDAGPDNNLLSLLVSLSDGPQLNGDVNITTTDLDADNGIVHVIDKVLTPPSVVDIAIANNSFTSLVNSVLAAGLDDDLSAEGPFTIFAPTDDAFVELLSDLGVSSLEEVPVETLVSVLTYHVVPGNVRSTELTSGEVNTLNPDASLMVNIEGENVTINENTNVVAVDVQGSNGVVHVIDKVLVPAESNTIVDIAMNDANFSILVDAVVKAGLAETLSGGEFTVFAPTNDAFNALFTELGVTLDDLSVEEVRNILLYHAVGSTVMSTDLSNGYVSTLNTDTPNGAGVSLLVDITDGVTLNGDANVIMPNIEANNGVVHVIDKVLMPIDIVDAAVDNPLFTSLVAALSQAELVSALQAEGPFTVFAPTDDAFAALLEALEVMGIDEIDNTTLTNVLLYHVVSGNVISSELSDGMVGTLNENNDITVSVTNDGVTLNDNVSIILVDVQTTNGVIHVIDQVLLPAN